MDPDLHFKRAALLLVASALALAFERPSLIDERRILPAEHPAIDYWNAKPQDAVARLQARLDSGKAKLAFDPVFGYLPAALRALGVPALSQVLVFSKTSFQASRIFPRSPRAIYHNDTVTVGYVRGSDVMEFAALDPKAGVVFYTLQNVESAPPVFEQHTIECIACHAGPATAGVPGLLVRSVKADHAGVPDRSPGFITDHRSPLEERWGGWYVSGEQGGGVDSRHQEHLGNVVYPRDGGLAQVQPLLGSRRFNVMSFEPYIGADVYLSPGSDIVSLMLLEHQTRMTNLIVRLGYEARLAMAEASGNALTPAVRNAAEETLRYLLFTDEAPLKAPVRGSPQFVREFESRGKKDARGRSLYQLDLNTRLLKYPCSYLIYSEAFRALPKPVLGYLYQRLGDVLDGKDTAREFASITPAGRAAIREILGHDIAAGASGGEAARR